MSQLQLEAYNPVGARSGRITVISVTTSSAEVDLSTKEIWTDADDGRMIRLRVEGDVWYNFDSVSGGSVDETATSGLTSGDWIPAGDFIDIRLPYVRSRPGATGQGICKYLRVKAPVACKLRISVSSEAPGAKSAG